MKQLTVILLGVVCYFHSNAQSSLLADKYTTTYATVATTHPASARFCNALHLVVMDLPKELQATKGEVVVNNSLQKTWKSEIHLGNFASEEVTENENGLTWNATAAKKAVYAQANEVYTQMNTYIRGCKSLMALEPDENAQVSKNKATGEITATHTWTVVEPLEHPLVGTQIVTTMQPEGNSWVAKITIQKIKE